ncbi:hypothetical protein ED733_008163 [Metarhizium rileyi]|uniref:Uncharacterized protein n=1 Tax=Metarhizium rileyi (strain RCEF 4871) TaxID=1649241 RepID=A0A5C6GJ74_METRR|nr:hypothetical protein ED733_008163 [Metarhizium rileyi]
MGWGEQHNTAKCSILYRDAVRAMIDRRLSRLYALRDSALKCASPQGVAFVASQTPLPAPRRLCKEENQLFELRAERDSSWESPWLSDLQLVQTWRDEQTYTLYNTWFATAVGNDYKTRLLSACQRGVELATDMDISLRSEHQATRPDALNPFERTFPAKMEAFLEHLSKGCCSAKADRNKSVIIHDAPLVVLFANEHFIDEAHLKQLQKEIDRLTHYRSRMLAEVKCRREAQMLNKNRWGHRSRRGGKVSLMKSLGLGSPLREMDNSNCKEFPIDTWEWWDRASTPSGIVLVPQSDWDVGQPLDPQDLSVPQSDCLEKPWNQGKIRW